MADRLTVDGQRAEAFLTWAESLCDTAPWFVKGGGHITGIVFDDEPDPGWRVALTYGLSAYAADVGNELLLMANTQEDAWLYALMQAAEERRHMSGGLEAGMTSEWPEAIAPGSSMNGFVLWEPFALPEGVSEVVHLPGRHVRLLQAVPVHRAEVAWLLSVDEQQRRGAVVDLLRPLAEAMYDVTRPPSR